MRVIFFCLSGLTLLALAACNPTFNWREVHTQDRTLTALLPCKPDSATRRVDMGAVTLDMHMMGCETGQATFAIAHVTAPAPGEAAQTLLNQWQQANLAALRAASPQHQPVRVAGAGGGVSAPQKVRAMGLTAQGQAVESQAVYFAQGAELFYAVILAERIVPELAETFFTGLRLP